VSRRLDFRYGRVVAAALVATLAGCSGGETGGTNPVPSDTGLEAVVEYGSEGLERTHVDGDVDYEQTPPVGGPHAPVWQDCGFYDAPVPDERAVHSLEHGAVWITYDPDLASDQLAVIEELAGAESYVLASPREGLPSPVVASAWGVQLTLPTASDPRLQAFVDDYAESPQAPEPGAPCSGGASDAGA